MTEIPFTGTTEDFIQQQTLIAAVQTAVLNILQNFDH